MKEISFPHTDLNLLLSNLNDVYTIGFSGIADIIEHIYFTEEHRMHTIRMGVSALCCITCNDFYRNIYRLPVND